MARRKTPAVYKQMARTLRHGFVDDSETAEFPERFPEGTSKAQITRDLRRKGYSVGKELTYRTVKEEGREWIVVTDVKRTGSIVSGYDAAAGYDLSDIENWTPQQKAALTRDYRKVRQLSGKPFQIYRPRKRENLETVQRLSHGNIKTPEGMKVAFVEVARPAEKADIKIKHRTVTKKVKGKPTKVRQPYVEITERQVVRTPTKWADIGLTKKAILKDPREAVRKMIKHIGGKQFSFMAGASTMAGAFTAEDAERELIELIGTYKDDWHLFVVGMQAYSMPRARDLGTYKRSRRISRDRQKAQRRRDRKRFRAAVEAEKKRQREQRRKRGK